MRPVKWISHPGTDVHMTPLVGEQLLIAEKFNLDVSDTCLPGSKRKNKKRSQIKQARRKLSESIRNFNKGKLSKTRNSKEMRYAEYAMRYLWGLGRGHRWITAKELKP